VRGGVDRLIANGAATHHWKTGHSYIKRKTAEIGALAQREAGWCG
jgi:phosphomannomutase/phosphoglucomutase